MAGINDFFFGGNTIKQVTDNEVQQTSNYLEPIRAFARTTYQSIYIIDYQIKGFEYVSDNPLFLCGHTSEEVKEMGYAFYFKYVPKQDLDLLLKINRVGFDFYEKIPVGERKSYTISYDFHIKTPRGKDVLINQKLTPLFLNNEGKIWKAICIISISAAHSAGNIRIYKKGDDKIFRYDLVEGFWRTTERVKLTNREKEILHLSSGGYTVNEIAAKIFVSPDTVKFHRRKLFQKLEVTNIAEAISQATDNKLV